MKTIRMILASLLSVLLLVSCASPAPISGGTSGVSASRSIEFQLKSAMSNGGMQFVGVGGEIAGQTNPTLNAKVGDTIQITLTSGEGALHDFVAPDFNAKSDQIAGAGKSTTFIFKVDQPGTFAYFCSVPGHREAGMEGKLVVTGEAASAPAAKPQPAAAPEMAMPPTAMPAATKLVDIVRAPDDLLAPIGTRPPQKLRVDLETLEVNGLLADGTTFTYKFLLRVANL